MVDTVHSGSSPPDSNPQSLSLCTEKLGFYKDNTPQHHSQLTRLMVAQAVPLRCPLMSPPCLLGTGISQRRSKGQNGEKLFFTPADPQKIRVWVCSWKYNCPPGDQLSRVRQVKATICRGHPAISLYGDVTTLPRPSAMPSPEGRLNLRTPQACEAWPVDCC